MSTAAGRDDTGRSPKRPLTWPQACSLAYYDEAKAARAFARIWGWTHG